MHGAEPGAKRQRSPGRSVPEAGNKGSANDRHHWTNETVLTCPQSVHCFGSAVPLILPPLSTKLRRCSAPCSTRPRTRTAPFAAGVDSKTRTCSAPGLAHAKDSRGGLVRHASCYSDRLLKCLPSRRGTELLAMSSRHWRSELPVCQEAFRSSTQSLSLSNLTTAIPELPRACCPLCHASALGVFWCKPH